MNKKKGLKLAATSLLVGLLALTACSKKKTTTKDNTTKNNVTTDSRTTKSNTTTKKVTTKKATTKSITTRDENAVMTGYNVYFDNKLCQNNSSVDITFSFEGYNLNEKVKVEAIYSDNSKEELDSTEYSIETNLSYIKTPGNYSLKVKYADFEDTDITLKVNPIKVDLSNVSVKENSFTYDGTNKELELTNLPAEFERGYLTYSIENGSKKDSGTYYANVIFESNSPYFTFYNAPSYLTNYSWTIDRGVAEFKKIDGATKYCDGREVEIKYENNVNAIATIYYKEKDADDSTYTIEAPKNKGSYIAKLVIDDAPNYDGCVAYTGFELNPIQVNIPYAESFGEKVYSVVTSYTGANLSFLDYIKGYDPNYMEIYSDDGYDISQQDKGEFVYKFKIKDSEAENIEFKETPKPITWLIKGDLSDYVESITINDENISISDFENLDIFDQESVVNIKTKNNYKVLVNQVEKTGDFEITSDITTISIAYLVGVDYEILYSKDIALDNKGIQYILVNGEKHYISSNNANNVAYFDKAEGTNLNITLVGIKKAVTNGIHKAYTKNGYSTRGFSTYNPTLSLDYDLSNVTGVDLSFTYNGVNYSFSIKEKEVISELVVTYYNINTKEVTYEKADYNSDKRLFEKSEWNQVCLGVSIVSTDEYKNATFKLIDKKTKEEIDFNNYIDYTIEIDIECYIDGIYLRTYGAEINSTIPAFDYDVFYSSFTGKYSTYTSDGYVKLPTINGMDLYVNGVKKDSPNVLFDLGITHNVIEYRITNLGENYSYKMDLVVLRCNSIFDYVSTLKFKYDNDDYEYDASNGELTNLFSEFMSSYHLSMLTFDDFEVVTKNGYTFNKEKSTLGFTDIYDPYSDYVIKFVFEKNNQEYIVYALVDYRDKIVTNLRIKDEKLVINASNENGSVSCNIFEDTVYIDLSTLPNNSSLHVITESEDFVDCYIKDIDGNDINMYNNGAKYGYYFYLEEKTYIITLHTLVGVERKITVYAQNGIKKNIVEVTRKGDEEEKLYFNSKIDDANLLPTTNGPVEMCLVGSFKDSSEYIIDGKYIDLNISGIYLDYKLLYKDVCKTTLLKDEERFEVYYDNDRPYIVFYMTLWGNELVNVYIYLNEQIDNNLSIDGIALDYNSTLTI